MQRTRKYSQNGLDAGRKSDQQSEARKRWKLLLLSGFQRLAFSRKQPRSVPVKTTSLLCLTIAAAHIIGFPLISRAGNETAVKENTTVASEKAPPLPIHTVEGVGGLVITPIAYLVNPGPYGTTLGLPSMAASYINMGEKNLAVASITETLFGRVELGYGVGQFGVGSLVNDVKELTNISIADTVVLHDFNVRVLALAENSFDLPLPAVTFGATYKYNDGISDMNQQLGGVLNSIGYQRNDGVDFTLTATKGFSKVFGRPLIVTAGLRMSEAEQLGYVGFGDKYRATFEGNLAYGILDSVWLAAEFRGNANAYQRIANPNGGALVDRVDNWWALGVTVLLSRHATITIGWGHLGPVINTTENECLGIQAKYEL